LRTGGEANEPFPGLRIKAAELFGWERWFGYRRGGGLCEADVDLVVDLICAGDFAGEGCFAFTAIATDIIEVSARNRMAFVRVEIMPGKLVEWNGAMILNQTRSGKLGFHK